MTSLRKGENFLKKYFSLVLGIDKKGEDSDNSQGRIYQACEFMTPSTDKSYLYRFNAVM